MVNRYPAPCRFCGGTIPADSGTVERVGQTWLAAHHACMLVPRRDGNAPELNALKLLAVRRTRGK